MLISESEKFQEKEQHNILRKNVVMNITSRAESVFNPLSTPSTKPKIKQWGCKIMRFKEGSAVEVLRRREQCDSWFPAKIISEDEYDFTVRYELFLNSEGDGIVEKVSKEDVRPHPPPVKGRERWVLGDIAEVFDLHSWRFGKIAKVLNDNRFVIRLFGSIQLKEFHRYNLRLWQTWQDNKWNVIGKVGGNKQINNNPMRYSSRCSQGLDCGALQRGIHEEIHISNRDSQEHLESFSPLKTLNRNHACHLKSSLGDAVLEGSGKKRKANIKTRLSDMLPMRTPPLLEQVDAVSSPKRKMGKICIIGSEMDVEIEKTNNCSLNPFSTPVRTAKESDECSVASCSINDFQEYTIQDSPKPSWYSSGSFFNNAKALSATELGRKYLPSYAKDELESNVHRLEVHAYNSTMQALYASGPLSWEQESLLTNLRLFLNISNEEHLLQLKHLLSNKVL